MENSNITNINFWNIKKRHPKLWHILRFSIKYNINWKSMIVINSMEEIDINKIY